jgi:hypothetical protein
VKANYTEAKAYYPINLPSFMLKTIEKTGEQVYYGGGIEVLSLTLKPVCLPTR